MNERLTRRQFIGEAFIYIKDTAYMAGIVGTVVAAPTVIEAVSKDNEAEKVMKTAITKAELNSPYHTTPGGKRHFPQPTPIPLVLDPDLVRQSNEQSREAHELYIRSLKPLSLLVPAFLALVVDFIPSFKKRLKSNKVS